MCYETSNQQPTARELELFSKLSKFKEDISSVGHKRYLNADGGDLEIFLQDSKTSDLSWGVEKIKDFCHGVRLRDLISGAGTAGVRRAAWVDQRNSPLRAENLFGKANGLRQPSKGVVRQHPNPLSAKELYELLKIPRFDRADLPDADRCLVYIANLDPHYIFALAETASFQQAPLLIDAIRDHLTYQTSLTVQIPSVGYSIFRLEFHLPYFVLRLSPPQNVGHRKPLREWRNLSFLDLQIPGSRNNLGATGILQAHISFVICGVDRSRWVGYAFTDDGDEEECLGEDLSDDTVAWDPIASVAEIDANIPIWDARGYFLKIVEVRTAKVLKRWQNLVQAIEQSIRQASNRRSSMLSGLSTSTADQTNIKEALIWTVRTTDLLRCLVDVLSESIRVWERFSSRNGDMRYFSDILNSTSNASVRASRSISDIGKAFEKMDDLRQKLHRLEALCKDEAQALHLLLIHESNKAAQFSGAFTKFTFTVLSPTALAIGFFSMPKAVIPFDLNSTTFFISILVTIAGVQLVFLLLETLSRPHWWLRLISWCMRMRELDSMRPTLLTSDICSKLGFIRRHSQSSGVIDPADVEKAFSVDEG